MLNGPDLADVFAGGSGIQPDGARSLIHILGFGFRFGVAARKTTECHYNYKFIKYKMIFHGK
jgi:hypothetical protein